MEEKEPVDLQRAEQTDLVSLIISGEEEAAQEEGDLGHCSGGEEDGIANGHIEDESESSMVTPIGSPGTSYWSITEGPDQPLLLSPIPGPSGCKPRVQRASRQGLSRIPGRDHRRYYHEYWRSEYLMDFDPLRHGMICMVCGSSLATLKLSTIKRHIRQKHPDSLLWSAADKEVIRSGWESHLSLEGSQRSYCSAAGPSPSPPRGKDEPPDATEYSSATVDPVNSVATCFITHEPSSADLGPEDPMPPQQQQQQQQPQQQQNPEPPSPPPTEPHPAAVEPPGEPKREDPAGPSTQTLKRYLNDSLHAWFRQEFLMEYEAEAGRLLCMVCGGQPPSLHLDHIKSHVLDGHPDSLVYSAEEKHCILQAWAQTHAEGAEGFVKSEPDTKDAELGLFPQDAGCGLLTQDACLIGEDGGLGPPEPAPPVRQPRRRRLRGGDPWRLRLDYLVAYGPQGRGTYCMVCSQALPETKVSGFRRHIQECHPETTSLSREEREAMAAAWTKDYHSEDTHVKEEAAASEPTTPPAAAAASPGAASPSKPAKRKREDEEEGGKAREGAAPSSSRHSHYPGKDQRRNYQVRWRMEYLMDYDCLRHGLICMVCGATLATLKVSTIKRHIQQVHPRSLAYSPAEKRQALLGYSQTALHFVHSDDCFSAQDHGHGVPLPPLQGLELDPDLEPDPDLDPHPEPDPDRDLEPDLDPAPDRDLEPDTEPAPDPEPDLEPEPEQE